ncbi:MAG: cytochrome c biogenesis protein CcdA [Chloroflexi bacterium]|nr:cytochrome c biogenesis protein CcdA [Chloroflexota bacterium]
MSESVVAVGPPKRFTILAHAILFMLGFSVVFVVGWGGAATLMGQLFVDNKALLGQVGGVIVIVFGLHTLGVLKLRWLSMDTRPDWQGAHGGGYLASVLMGIVFAAGWTPCIGTTLGAILTLGMSQQNSGQAMLLASGYALGLGLPFIAISLLMDRAFALLRRVRRYTPHIQIVSGLLLIVMGVLLLTNQLFYLSIWAQRNGLYLDLQWGGTATPNYLIAIVGGLISFVSPCVLPLVPAYVSYLGGRARMRGV